MINDKNIFERSNKIIRSVNKILRENKSINEEPAKMNANEKFIEQSWKSLTNKTKVFETIPLIYAVSEKDDLSAEEIIAILNKKYDWDDSGKEWLLTILKKIKKDSKAFDTFKKVVIAGTVDPNAPTLKDLYNGQPASGFIHKNITKFYAKLKSVSKYNPKSKTFTADVVLFWGPDSVESAFQGDLLKDMKPDADSLIKLKGGKTVMACVSLKALEGRVGKVTTLFIDKFGGDATVEEGVLDLFKNTVTKVKDAGSAGMKKLKDYFTDFTEWVKNTTDELTDIFSPSNKSVADAQVEAKEIETEAEDVLSEFDVEITEHLNRSGKPITEANEDEPIQISHCFREKLLSWYSKFENDTKKYNKAFEEFEKNISEYSTKNFFRMQFKSLPKEKSDFKKELTRIKSIIDSVKRAKAVENTDKKQKCMLLVDAGNPVTFTRKEIKTILMSNANYIAIDMLNKMIEEYLKKTDKKSTKQAIQNLIKFATEINAEAIFGGALEVPLIKYNGKVIIKYGSRSNYEATHTTKMVEYFNSAKTIPIIGLKIYPVQNKSGEVSTYYMILMYSLSDYKGSASSKPKDSDFSYNFIMINCNSGSDFRFSVESSKTVDGASVTKAFMG